MRRRHGRAWLLRWCSSCSASVVSRLEEGAAVGSAWTTWYKMELRDFALFLTHVAPFYPYDLADMVDQIGIFEEQLAHWTIPSTVS